MQTHHRHVRLIENVLNDRIRRTPKPGWIIPSAIIYLDSHDHARTLIRADVLFFTAMKDAADHKVFRIEKLGVIHFRPPFAN